MQEAVNREIQERIRTRYGGQKLKYQSPAPWTPNAAFVNCYNGPQESVGWVCTTGSYSQVNRHPPVHSADPHHSTATS